MHPAREKMQSMLKAIVVPKLRSMGFKGSFPHFRRVVNGRAALVTFQFNLSGGSFVVELSTCAQSDIQAHWNESLTLNNVTTHDMNNRYRLGADAKGNDYWFTFGKKNYEPNHEILEPDSAFQRVANEVNELIEHHAEAIWQELSVASSVQNN